MEVHGSLLWAASGASASPATRHARLIIPKMPTIINRCRGSFVIPIGMRSETKRLTSILPNSRVRACKIEVRESSHRLFGKMEVRRFVSDLIPILIGITNEPRRPVDDGRHFRNDEPGMPGSGAGAAEAAHSRLPCTSVTGLGQ